VVHRSLFAVHSLQFAAAGPEVDVSRRFEKRLTVNCEQ